MDVGLQQPADDTMATGRLRLGSAKPKRSQIERGDEDIDRVNVFPPRASNRKPDASVNPTQTFS